MPASSAELEAVKQFLSETSRAVLVTRRKDGGVQTSPMSVVADDAGNVLTATRSRNAKAYNLNRDPRAALCVFTEQFLGPWMHVEGEVEMTRLPEAFPLLADYYRRRGLDTSTDAFRERMFNEDRILIRVKTERVVHSPRG
jgi:PPOX class probable F420-dependent enzyme